jgi:flavorubredoxin
MIKNITKQIIYIGVDDTDIDLFESQYVVPNGVSYNSYLILDEKVAIMDTVDYRKHKEWLANLDSALNGRTPDYLVVQHLEPDHAGSIAKVVERYTICKS